MTVKWMEQGQRLLARSDDVKPTAGILPGARLLELDTWEEYLFDGDTWLKLRPQGKTYRWTGEAIPPGGYFLQAIPVEDFALATAFALASGSIQLSFRAGDEASYAWDPLGTMQGASLQVSAQAQVAGLPQVYLVATNGGTESVTASITVYLGRRG